VHDLRQCRYFDGDISHPGQTPRKVKTVFIVKTPPTGPYDFGQDLAALPAADCFTEVSVEFTSYSGHAIDIARQCCGSADLVVASGTANDFIKSTSLRGTLAEVISLAASGSYRPVDLGRVDYSDREDHQASRYFINVADMGIGASVVRRVNASSRHVGATAHYLWSIITAFIDYRKPSIRVRSDAGLDWQGRALACIIGNGRCFGSGLYAVPDAVIDDGRLHSAIIGDVSLLDFVRKLPRLKWGRPITHPEVIYHTCGSVTISALDGQCAMDVDGEYLDCREVSISVVPAALLLLLP
jgi:diacylglycerol kinase family enzyme